VDRAHRTLDDLLLLRDEQLWETNYKASQEGPTTFRYSIEPHGKFASGGAARFGAERSQPLVVVRSILRLPFEPPF